MGMEWNNKRIFLYQQSTSRMAMPLLLQNGAKNPLLDIWQTLVSWTSKPKMEFYPTRRPWQRRKWLATVPLWQRVLDEELNNWWVLSHKKGLFTISHSKQRALTMATRYLLWPARTLDTLLVFRKPLVPGTPAFQRRMDTPFWGWALVVESD